MDAPIVFTVVLNPEEIDDEAYEMETVSEYPLELYEKSWEFASPSDFNIPSVQDRLGTDKQYDGILFTHNTELFWEGPLRSRYVDDSNGFMEMREKVNRQLLLQSKIRAIDLRESVEKIIISHLLPDIIGNARKFGRQQFRCTKCNTKYRRPPLGGKCLKCGNKLVLTIHPSSVLKYLDLAIEIAEKYKVSRYTLDRLYLMKKETDSLFQSDKPKQKTLADFF